MPEAGDRGANRDAGPRIAASDLDAVQALGARLDRDDLAHIGGDAGKHIV